MFATNIRTLRKEIILESHEAAYSGVKTFMPVSLSLHIRRVSSWTSKINVRDTRSVSLAKWKRREAQIIITVFSAR